MDQDWLFDESNIDFSQLSDNSFEELCFDLLTRLGYERLAWRRGGADSGRDIEGFFPASSALVSSYHEKWFFECKRYTKGVPVDALSSKCAWADAERPQHLVLLLSSYLSNSARTWLEKTSPYKPYHIHVIEGKQLKRLIAAFPDLIDRYFADKYTRLLLDCRHTWLVHNILPSPDVLYALSRDLNCQQLSREQLAFLWCAHYHRADEGTAWIEDNDIYSFEHCFRRLIHLQNCQSPIYEQWTDAESGRGGIGTHSIELTYKHYITAELVLDYKLKPRLALYALVSDDAEKEALEVIIEAQGDYPTKIRHIRSGVRAEFERSGDHLFKARPKRTAP